MDIVEHTDDERTRRKEAAVERLRATRIKRWR